MIGTRLGPLLLLCAAILVAAPADGRPRDQSPPVGANRPDNQSPPSGADRSDNQSPRAAGDRNGACPYTPGASFTAEVHITVMDANTPTDSADVTLTGIVPDGGRQSSGRYVASLPPRQVNLREAALKNFTLAPHVMVEQPNSSACRLDLDANIPSRSPAFAATTQFTFDVTVRIGGHIEHAITPMVISCFDQDTPVRLASGETARASDLVAGDEIWDPVSKTATRIERVIQGPEAGETLYRLGDGAGSVLFTAGHPLMTRRGPTLARQVAVGDELMDADGQWRRITVARTAPGDPTRRVYNFVLAGPHPDGHWLTAGGFAAGDYTLQEAARTGGAPMR
jgi:hypothetical protein